ncbi:MAG: hypothetical protein EB078_06785 [Proteobacteria bacterium]|nr:hypothetical protein [Pseudomonadota bacterium]NDC25691.1 hypothetical protein [Pseudomonadota bacterium]NDD04593.1 hypothetical protein [Pseudomonadota bacterium]NDG28217.1 hypothetical protein [Pseudomonadota bacterium]
MLKILFLAVFFTALGIAEEVIAEPPVETNEKAQESILEVALASVSWRYGFELQGMGALSKVDYADGLSHGYGYGISLLFERPLSPQYRLIVRSGYQQLSVARFIDASGAVVENSPEFTQTQSGLFLSALGSFQVFKTSDDSSEIHEIWIDAGAEYFHGLRAEQKSSFNSLYAFDPSKFVFLVVGPSIVWNVRNGWNLSASLHGFLNLVGANRFEMGGGKLGIALNTPL